MYLKSLVLKGFKSFADRSVLNLQPGITAIVGPNGSGKSNISDAVLWVLGERSARNLRGQAMEDIIFSGSAARRAVSVAEVDLVLDNSDKTLPIEFDEVVITRRMYRSGESEYLVNGVVSRRLDVLDILHDTGLGAGTHSIISQGSLDSILRSKPEERRALIEEAAGVLKHKQRKEKSARKLEVMDHHLERVRDVVGEVERQLRPLERKAKRAEAYKEVSAQLENVRLALAVEELRKLQEQWDKVCEAEKLLSEEVEQHRANVASAEQKVNDFQELMKRESEDASELARRQRRAANLAERLDSAEMLLRERRRNAAAYEADARASIENAAQQRAAFERDVAAAKEQLSQTRASYAEMLGQIEGLVAEKRQLDADVREAQSQIDRLLEDTRRCEQQADEAKRAKDSLQEGLANSLAHVKLVEARKSELSRDLQRSQEDEQDAVRAFEEAAGRLKQLEQLAQQAQEESARKQAEREQVRERLEQAQAEVSAADAEIRAIKAAIRTYNEEKPALAWLIEHASEVEGGITSLSSALKVDGTLETLVEALLGEDLAALAVKDGAAALSIARSLERGSIDGDVSLIASDLVRMSGGNAPARSYDGPHGHALLDDLDYPAAIESSVEALLGDVVVCDTREQALAAGRADARGLRFISRDGFALWPSGKVRIFGSRTEGDEGLLARERRLVRAQENLAKWKDRLAAAGEDLKEADLRYREAQERSLQASQELAGHRGVCTAAEAERERATAKLAKVVRELQDINHQVRMAHEKADELHPKMQEAESRVLELLQQRNQLAEQRDKAVEQIEPMRAGAAKVAESLNECKLSAAKYEERKIYAERLIVSRETDIEALEQDVSEARVQMAVKLEAAHRGKGLLEVFSRLASGLADRARLLDEAMNASESATSSVHADAAEARGAARKAHDEYDGASSRMTKVQVEKSRLEVQVEAAVNTVVRDCRTPLEIADQMPRLDDVTAYEDEKFRLERRIRNMGSINPDAAEEYEELKERYDFLVGQLDDMEDARRSLKRIVRVIDERMKDDFIETFEQVNSNFNEIFSLLFPGGSAHLTLVDPDDLENTGVEVTAQPRGKRLTKMMLMSGGEKSLTALALLFAVYKTHTTPFYILDEVEAALDDTNLRRLIAYIDSLRSTTQLIMITHQRRTMEMADVLFGVSMQADGVTKVISQKLERALEHAQEE